MYDRYNYHKNSDEVKYLCDALPTTWKKSVKVNYNFCLLHIKMVLLL